MQGPEYIDITPSVMVLPCPSLAVTINDPEAGTVIWNHASADQFAKPDPQPPPGSATPDAVIALPSIYV